MLIVRWRDYSLTVYFPLFKTINSHFIQHITKQYLLYSRNLIISACMLTSGFHYAEFLLQVYRRILREFKNTTIEWLKYYNYIYFIIWRKLITILLNIYIYGYIFWRVYNKFQLGLFSIIYSWAFIRHPSAYIYIEYICLHLSEAI